MPLNYKALNVQAKTIRLLEENADEYLVTYGIKDSLTMMSKTQT